MSTSNLWGDLPQPLIARTPLQILREQASELTKMTKGVLVGFVRQQAVNREGFGFELSIRAPALNDYSITILAIQYGLQMYPLQVMDFFRNRESKCQDEASFLNALMGILQSSAVRNAISALLSQSNDLASDAIHSSLNHV